MAGRRLNYGKLSGMRKVAINRFHQPKPKASESYHAMKKLSLHLNPVTRMLRGCANLKSHRKPSMPKMPWE